MVSKGGKSVVLQVRQLSHVAGIMVLMMLQEQEIGDRMEMVSEMKLRIYWILLNVGEALEVPTGRMAHFSMLGQGPDSRHCPWMRIYSNWEDLAQGWLR